MNQSKQLISRRRMAVGLLATSAFAVACSQPAASPTSAPTTAASTAAQPTTPSATAPTVSSSPSAQASAAPSASEGQISGPFDGEARSLNGAGATFPAVLYSKWFAEYEKITGVQVNYQAIGSGGGIKAISDGTVDFGATDGPMSDQQLAAAKGGAILHIPTALGAVVPTYNVPEAGNEPLKFTGDTLAGIFLGEIEYWNDARLVADNPVLQNVNQPILPVHRSDGSGTTYIFVDYLASVSQTWKSRVGVGTAVNWPTGLGGRGNQGVAGEIKQNPYSIGYVELIYARQNQLGFGQVRNANGQFVLPTLEAVTAAAEGAAASIPADLRASIVNAPGAGVYPISGLTWILAYENMPKRPEAIALTRLLWWALHDGQRFSGDLDYAPLPASLVARAEQMIRSIKVNGEPAFPGR